MAIDGSGQRCLSDGCDIDVCRQHIQGWLRLSVYQTDQIPMGLQLPVSDQDKVHGIEGIDFNQVAAQRTVANVIEGTSLHLHNTDASPMLKLKAGDLR